MNIEQRQEQRPSLAQQLENRVAGAAIRHLDGAEFSLWMLAFWFFVLFTWAPGDTQSLPFFLAMRRTLFMVMHLSVHINAGVWGIAWAGLFLGHTLAIVLDSTLIRRIFFLADSAVWGLAGTLVVTGLYFSAWGWPMLGFAITAGITFIRARDDTTV